MSYNAGGLVVTKTDARGKVTNYIYDVLGRVTQMNLNDGTIFQSYDVAVNGVGRLASVTDLSGLTNYAYDTYGRVIAKGMYITGLTHRRTCNCRVLRLRSRWYAHLVRHARRVLECQFHGVHREPVPPDRLAGRQI